MIVLDWFGRIGICDGGEWFWGGGAVLGVEVVGLVITSS